MKFLKYFFIAVILPISILHCAPKNHDTTTFKLPQRREPVFTKRCNNTFSDSLFTFIDSIQFGNNKHNIDSSLIYSVQFSRKINLETDFQNQLANQDECIEEADYSTYNLETIKKEFNGIKRQYRFFKKETKTWLLVSYETIPRIGNSTYWSIHEYYFIAKKEN